MKTIKIHLLTKVRAWTIRKLIKKMKLICSNHIFEPKLSNHVLQIDVDLFEKLIPCSWQGGSFEARLTRLNFHKKYCPRDAKIQVNYFRRNIKLKNVKKNDLIFWKGHVAIALSNKKLIHAYGPMKKTVIMGINQTIERIKRTANLKVIGIKRP